MSKLHRCQALDDDGKRCRRKTANTDHVFSDPSHGIHRWFLIHVCPDHDVALKRSTKDYERAKAKDAKLTKGPTP